MSDIKINDAEYIDMCGLMIESDAELKRKLDSLNLQDKDVWLFFGPSKAGKSTLLARIKSNIPQNTFMDFVESSKNNSGKMVELEGIKVKHEGTATTTVPNIYIKNGQPIIDLAGFIDPNNRREPVISLLNNGLFAKIKRCKIILIVNMASFDTANTQFRTYYTELKKLLNESNYQLGLGSCACIVTKGDIYSESLMKQFPNKYKMQLTTEFVVDQSFKNFSSQMSASDSKVSTLVGVLSDKHIVMDYKRDDCDTVFKNIQEMMSNVSSMDTSLFKFDIISASNRLNDESLMIINGFKEIINKSDQDIKGFQKSQLDTYFKNLENLRRESEQYSENVKTINKTEISINTWVKSEENLKETIKRCNIEQTDLELELLSAEQNQESFNKRIDNFVMLWVNPIISTKRGGLTTDYGVRIEVPKPPGCRGDQMIFIYKFDDYKLHEDKITLCFNLGEFSDLKLPFIYSNGQKMQGNPIITVDSNTDGKSTSLVTSSRIPHVVLFLCDVHVNKTKMKPLTTNYFLGQIEEIRKAIQRKEVEIESSKVLISSGITQQQDDKKMVIELKKINEQILNNGVSIKEIFKSNQQTNLSSILTTLDKIKGIRNNIILKYVEDLSKVLIAGNIMVSTYRVTTEFKKQLDSMIELEHKIISSCSDYLADVTGIQFK